MKAYGIENFEERLANAREAREKMRAEKFAAAAKAIGDEGARALSELYGLYDERFYLWLAGLWEPEIGGFYYSNSARDTEGYLPDIESTAQAMNGLSNLGIFEGRGGHYSNGGTPEFMRERLIAFASSLIDPEDGYAYHPQWGYNITTSRRGRDLNWTVGLLKNLGATPPCETAYDKLSRLSSSEKKSEEAKAVLPEHLHSTEAFSEYLLQFEDPSSRYYIEKNSYGSGNLLQSQMSQFKAAGEEYLNLLFAMFERHQREDNGSYEAGASYNATNGLMKIMLMYSAAGREFPMAERALLTTVAAATGEERPGWVCCFYNPIITILNLLNNIKKFGSPERAEALRKMIIENAPRLIRVTKEKIKIFAKADGGFSYYPEHTISGSQNAPVALDKCVESDVNASCISSTGVLSNLCSVLGIERIPAFCQEDGDLFFDIIERAEVKPKINPIPEALKVRSKERT